jgi:predicted GNAT family N-acyltransferase
MIEVKNISSNDTISVRHPVLRNGKSLETCFFEGDILQTTKHFGVFFDKNIIGVVSVFKNININFADKNQYQIRGMAVLDEYQNKRFGKKLIEICETTILNENGNLIWLNAREKAVSFYEKSGYVKSGIIFNIDIIGIHHLMMKNLL